MSEDHPHARGERPLPLDPDIEADESRSGSPLPIHLSPRFLALVAIGGAAGTAVRHLLAGQVGAPGHFPLGTLTVNLLGALALGVLLEALAWNGSDVGHRRTLRLLLGTGFLGGFTTYSTLALDTDTLVRGDLPWLAAGYALASVTLGLVASVCGIALARKVVR